MKNTYEIWFGVDPEKLPDGEWTWPDNFDRTDEFKRKYTVGYFVTNDKDSFKEVIKSVIKNPPSMWYWVIVNDYLVTSGAIDPDDVEILKEV